MILAIHGSGWAADSGRIFLRTTQISLIYPPGLEDRARFLHNLFPELVERLHKTLGDALGIHPVVILEPSRTRFQKMAGRAFLIAFALPKRSLIAIHADPHLHGRRLRSVFMHELTHLALHQDVPPDAYPLWFEEGICQWISGTIGELPDEIATTMTLKTYPLRLLQGSFPSDHLGLRSAYAESEDVIRYLVERYGVASVRSILSSVQHGTAFSKALRKAVGLSPTELEFAWRRNRHGALLRIAGVARAFPEFLFAVSALLAMAGALFHRIRKRRLPMEGEDGEDTEDLEHPTKESDLF